LARRSKNLLRFAATVGLVLAIVGWWRHFEEHRYGIVIVGANAAVVAMFLRLAYLEDLHRKRCALRLVPMGDPDREEHLRFLRGHLRETTHSQTRDQLAKLYNHIRVYVRDGNIEPLDLPDPPPGLRGLAPLTRRRAVSNRTFVVVPRNADPYWLACNRPIEAMKYCRRVHADGFGIALWSRPVPRGVRLVDLIG
jgi:hypothetical protein